MRCVCLFFHYHNPLHRTWPIRGQCLVNKWLKEWEHEDWPWNKFVHGGLWPIACVVLSRANQNCTQSSGHYQTTLSHTHGFTQSPDVNQGASFPPYISCIEIWTFLRCCNDNGVQPVPWISKKRKLIQNKTSCQYFNQSFKYINPSEDIPTKQIIQTQKYGIIQTIWFHLQEMLGKAQLV